MSECCAQLDPVRDDAAELVADVLDGLAAPVPVLPPKYFYDARGARLFDRICRLPEYYLTRTEIGILESSAAEIAELIGPRARVIEFGSGSGLKTRILLRSLDRPAGYVPIDVSVEQLRALADELRAEFPSLDVRPLAADYTADPVLPHAAPGTARTIAFFPGSSIGNMEVDAAAGFLAKIRALCGRGGALLIGADLHKDAATLELAYNDPRGVTAEFNLNLLRRINRECGADFPLEAFRHRAIYDPEWMRIEMRLECTRRCTVTIPSDGRGGPATFTFEPGEHILTEYSHKYTPESFQALAARGGWSVRRSWVDSAARFSVWLLE